MSNPSNDSIDFHALDEIVIAGRKVDIHRLRNIIEQETRVADQCIAFLELIGVRYIFGIQSFSNLPLYDALCSSKIQTIIPKNEAGAAYSASKYAASENAIGVCVLAGTVGVNNAVGGISDAFVHKHPVLILSGSPTKIRMQRGGIQNLDTISVTRPITKYSHLVNSEEDIFPELYKAVTMATTPPFGPVHLSIPVDIQNSMISRVNDFRIELDPTPHYDLRSLSAAVDRINREDRGIIYAGRGAKRYSSLVKGLSQKLSWPIIATPRGKGVVEDDFEYYMGNYGMCAADFTKHFVENYKSTCLLILGSSLKELSIPDLDDSLMKNKTILHIDHDKNELNKVFEVDIPVYHDLGIALPELMAKCHQKQRRTFPKSAFNPPYTKNHTGISVRHFLEHMFEYLPNKLNIISDIGEFMTYILKYLPSKHDMKFDISMNYGAMGTGIGGAVGACLASPDYQTMAIVGDGGLFMNGMEIFTAREYNLPIIYIIINNATLGFVANGQQILFNKTNDHAMQKRVEFSDMFNAIGIPGLTIRENEELQKLKDFTSHLDGPCVIELATNNTEQSPMMDRLLMLQKMYRGTAACEPRDARE